jgi:hypothetical protein
VRLPQPVRRFVQQRLASVAELEGLLLVRSAPEQRWNAREVAARLYISQQQARVVLDALHRQDLTARSGADFLYQPASEALGHDVDALAAAYPRFLIAITELIHAKSRGVDTPEATQP